MEHFKDGKCIQEPFEDYVNVLNQSIYDIGKWGNTLQNNLIDVFTRPTNNFRKGKAISILEMIEEINEMVK